MEKRPEEQPENHIVVESVGEAVKEEAADILGAIPVVGKILSMVAKVAQKVCAKIKEKMAGGKRPPRFMQAVKFCCKKNQIISGQQSDEIELILHMDYESEEKESLEDVKNFIESYVGEEIHTEFVEDCVIAKDYLWIHLCECEQFLYDGECLQKTMNALNKLLREEVFDRFEAWGHDEDFRYD